jgi:hypothetical protein
LKFTAAGTADDDEFTLDSEVKGLSFGFYIQGPAPYEFSVYLFFRVRGRLLLLFFLLFPYIPPYRLLKYNLIIRIRQGSL